MITARMQEFEYYDPMTDSEMVRLMCVTSVGTWFTEVEMSQGSRMREAKRQFQQHVMADIDAGRPARWLQL